MQKYKKGVMIVCEFLGVWLNSVKWRFFAKIVGSDGFFGVFCCTNLAQMKQFVTKLMIQM
jgi:hypothetical protein